MGESQRIEVKNKVELEEVNPDSENPRWSNQTNWR